MRKIIGASQQKLDWTTSRGSKREISMIYSLAVIIYLVTIIKAPAFLSGSKVLSVFVFASFLGIFGLAQMLVLLIGGVDLSLPWTMNMSAILVAFLPHSGAALMFAVLVALGSGALVGLLNGIGIAFIGIPPIIMTLGMNGLVQGVIDVLTHGQGFLNAPATIHRLASGAIVGLPILVLGWAMVAVIAIFLLSWTASSAKLYAVGNSIEVSRLSGIGIRRVLLGAYTIDGLLAAFGGILLGGFIGQSYLGMGNPYLFTSVAAAVVGGVSIYGGSGGYAGVIGGALTLTASGYLFAAFRLGPGASDVGFGVLVVAIVALAVARRSTERGILPNLWRSKSIGREIKTHVESSSSEAGG
jgi:ribose transport system permease protein